MPIFILIFLFFLACLPSFIWLWIYRLQDKEHPEPRSLIRKLFLAGILITPLVVLLEGVVIGIIPATDYSFWKTIPKFGLFFNILTAVFITALVEEYLKYFITKKIVWPLRAFDQIIDGVIYGVSVALGFSLVENFLYFFSFAFQNQSASINNFGLDQINSSFWNSLLLVFFFRFLSTTLMHTLCSGMAGLYLGKAHFAKPKLQNNFFHLNPPSSPSKTSETFRGSTRINADQSNPINSNKKNSSSFIRRGLFLAISFHMLFNFLAYINQIFFAFILIFGLALYFIPHLKIKENLKVRFRG